MTERRETLFLLAFLLTMLATMTWLFTPPDTGPALPEVPDPVEEAVPEFADPRTPQTLGDAVELDVWTRVRCPLTVELVGRNDDQKVGLLADPETTDLTWVSGWIRDGALQFSVKVSEGAGLVTLYGYEQAPVVWFTTDEGDLRCVFSKDPQPIPMARLLLQVDAPADIPAEDLYVRACGQSIFHDWKEPYELLREEGTCLVRACRRSGALWGCGGAVRMDLDVGTHEVTLDVPDYEPAGLPLTFSHTDLGLQVDTFVPGSAAEEELEEGDQIVAIDGEPLSGLTSVQRYELSVGPEGTEVVLRIRRGEEELEITLPRQFVPKP